MGLEAFVVYAFLCSRYASEPLKAQDIAVATGMTEANVKQALQTLAHFQQPHATPDRSVARRVQETARQFLDRTMEAL